MTGTARLVAAGATLALLTPLLAEPALADEGDPVTGWWSRTRIGAPSPVEAPDTVPEGGLHVAGGLTGRVAVSALRAELAPDVRATALTLEVAEARGSVAVTVCATAARWDPVEGGRLEDAPPEDCTVPATGAIEDGRLLVTLDAASPAGPLDVVLLPADGAVFSLTLQRPTAAAVTVEPVLAEAPPPQPPDAGPVGTDPGAAAGADSGSGSASLDVPLFPAVEPLPLPLPLPLPDTATAVAAPLVAGELPALPGTAAPPPALAAAPQVAFVPVPAAVAPLDPRRHTVPAALLLAVLLAVAIWLQAEPARPPRALGGAARARRADPAPDAAAAGAPLAPVRGVGRFRRPRPELAARTASVADREHGVGRFRRTRPGPVERL